MIENNNGKMWHRRFKAWIVWFIALFSVNLTVLFMNKPLDLFSEWAKWSTIGLIALIGGLTLTDAVFGRKA